MNTTFPNHLGPMQFGSKHPIRNALLGAAAVAAVATPLSATSAMAAEKPDTVSIAARSAEPTPDPTLNDLQKQLEKLHKEIAQLQDNCDTNMAKSQKPCQDAIKLAEKTAKYMEKVPGHQNEKDALNIALEQAKTQSGMSLGDSLILAGVIGGLLGLAALAARGISGHGGMYHG